MKSIDELHLGDRLPSPRGVALTLMNLCQREGITVQEVARAAQADPALSGRLIKQANAAASRGGRPTASVNDAVMQLGIGAVRQLALGFSLVDQHLRGACDGFDYARFWSHSLLMAVAAQNLGRRVRAGAADELFACGLMARIGCLGLATAYPEEYGELLRGDGAEDSLLRRERQRLETDHDEVSAAMLLGWGIPMVFAEPVLHHEDPEAAGFAAGSRAHLLTHVLYMAKRLADLGVAESPDRARIIAELLLLAGKFGLDAEDLAGLVDQSLAQWREWGAILNVPATTLPAFASMETAAPMSPQAEPGATALRILLVEDNASTRLMLEKLLHTQCGHEVHTATNGRDALALALEVQPQVVVTDWVMPEMDGLELCKALRATDWGHSLYLLMLTSVESADDVIRAYEAGVDEYITKPVDIRTLQARLRAAWRYVRLREEWERDRAQLRQFAAELAVANRKLEHAALTDPLTGLYNRRAAMDLLDRAWSGAIRASSPLVVMAIDIDHFKSINDQHGHAVGDRALLEIARAMRAGARKEDELCRIGGEEFLVVCQHVDLMAALNSAERLRKTVLDLRIETGSARIQTSVSIGVAQMESGMKDPDVLINSADQALYSAKHQGRNSVCLFSQGKVRCVRPT